MGAKKGRAQHRIPSAYQREAPRTGLQAPTAFVREERAGEKGDPEGQRNGDGMADAHVLSHNIDMWKVNIFRSMSTECLLHVNILVEKPRDTCSKSLVTVG